MAHPLDQTPEERQKQWQAAGGMDGADWEPDPAALDLTVGEEEEEEEEPPARGDLDRWERKALNRLKEGRSPDAPFTPDALSEGLAQFVAERLGDCRTAAEVHALFRAARAKLALGGNAWERKHAGYLWQVRRQQAERRELEPDA